MQEVLEKISPKKEERLKVERIIASFLTQLNSKLSEARAILGGSGAKNSWLSGSHDIDIFVQFDYKKHANKSFQLSEILEKTLKKSFPKETISRVHGSRDYFQLKYQNLNVEIIPILKIKKAEEATNITDISPLHAVWVNKNTKEVKDEIRLAKQFCKANNCYGAESYICGFSGYVLEILIAYYGSFKKLLQATQKWKEKTVIDVEEYYKGKNVFFQLNKSKLNSPLIVIDPVDKNRNACAALNMEKFNLFKERAQEFLEQPNAKYFEKEIINLEKLKKEKGALLSLIYLQVKPTEGKKDVVGVKLLKFFEFLRTELAPFKIIKSEWQWNKEAIFYFLLKEKKLEPYHIRKGPPLNLKEHVAEFKKRNKTIFEKDGYFFAKVKNETPLLKDFVEDLLKNDYLKEKFLKAKLILE